MSSRTLGKSSLVGDRFTGHVGHGISGSILGLMEPYGVFAERCLYHCAIGHESGLRRGGCRAFNAYPLDNGFRVTSIDELGNQTTPGRAGPDPARNPRRRTGDDLEQQEKRRRRFYRQPPPRVQSCHGPVPCFDSKTRRAFRPAMPVNAGRSRASQEPDRPKDGSFRAPASTNIYNVKGDRAWIDAGSLKAGRREQGPVR